MISPCSSTMIASLFLTVDSLWAITNVVRPVMTLSIDSCTSISVLVSIDEVASSRINTGGPMISALAMESSWACPSESPVSVPLITVSYPSGRRVMKWWAWVLFAPLTTSSSVALGFYPY